MAATRSHRIAAPVVENIFDEIAIGEEIVPLDVGIAGVDLAVIEEHNAALEQVHNGNYVVQHGAPVPHLLRPRRAALLLHPILVACYTTQFQPTVEGQLYAIAEAVKAAVKERKVLRQTRKGAIARARSASRSAKAKRTARAQRKAAGEQSPEHKAAAAADSDPGSDFD